MKKKSFIAALMLLAALALPVMLSACRQAPVSEEGKNEPIAGADWRTWRGYSSATINDEAKLSTLYFLYDDGTLEFDLNEAGSSPTVLLTIDLSGEKDPGATAQSLENVDINDDGFKDIVLTFEDGRKECWQWLPEEFVFSDESILVKAADGTDPKGQTGNEDASGIPNEINGYKFIADISIMSDAGEGELSIFEAVELLTEKDDPAVTHEDIPQNELAYRYAGIEEADGRVYYKILLLRSDVNGDFISKDPDISTEMVAYRVSLDGEIYMLEEESGEYSPLLSTDEAGE